MNGSADQPSPWQVRLPLGMLMLLILALVLCTVTVLAVLLRRQQPQETAESVIPRNSVLSPIFTPEVQYWEDEIDGWSATYGLDPDMVATVMQIESCGNPIVASPAGAQGLFQVMPFHFDAGENPLDPQTNARRGLTFLATLLEQTHGNPGLAFAGYNGGPGAAASGPSGWVDETERYFYWSTGIYNEAIAGKSKSARLDEWLAAGGAVLCQQAAAQLELAQ